MISFSEYRAQWFGNIRGDLLAGLVVALALIPEAIAFSHHRRRGPQGGALRQLLYCRADRLWGAGTA
jgi:MFS superfamily sulfate permease-like transporter